MPKRGAARLYPRGAAADEAIASYGLGLVEGAAENSVALPATAGDQLVAVSLGSAEANQTVTFQPLVPGVEVEIVAGAAFADDALLAAGVDGRFHDAAVGELQQLKALGAATEAGDVVTARVLADWVDA